MSYHFTFYFGTEQVGFAFFVQEKKRDFFFPFSLKVGEKERNCEKIKKKTQLIGF